MENSSDRALNPSACRFLVVLATCLLAEGCSKPSIPAGAPAEFREHTKFADCLSWEKKTGQKYVVAFDANRYSKADTWEHWDFTQHPALRMSTVDKDFNGIIDNWIYFDPTNSLYRAWDSDGDGIADSWQYRNGSRRALTNEP